MIKSILILICKFKHQSIYYDWSKHTIKELITIIKE